ncbi:MAG: mcP2, partial [Myxococcaceae bacterium]|nr:mcP2 [Myxococcaceae bacterium]
MQIDLWLKDRVRWLQNPSTGVNLTLVAIATLFAWLTLELTANDRTLLGMLITLGAGAAVVHAELRAMRRLRALRGLGSGALPVTREALVQAIGEVHRLPDTLAVLTALSWVIVVAAVALALVYFGDASAATGIRLAALGLLFGPLSAALVNLLVMRRGRVLIEAMAAGVSSQDVLTALPATRLQLRARLVAITVALVFLPSVVLVDASREQTERGLQSVIQAGGDRLAQQQLAAPERWKVYGRMALLFTVVLGAALLTAWAAGSVMADPMRKVAAEAQRMARGELARPQVFAASDEVWAVTRTFSLMQAQLHDALAQLARAGSSIASTTRDLVGTSAGYEAGSAEQAASLNQTSATTEQLAQSARQISVNATEVSEISQRTLDSANAGHASAEEFARAVERMRQDNRTIAEAVSRLQRRVQQIGKIVEFITGVADRSDLLALSAELEGTKAGEVGRSFTLVAAEMRRLAENVLESTTEIEELIGEVREATHVTVDATESGLQQTTSGTALAGEVTRALVEVVRLAQQTSGAVRAITLATQQQQTGTDQLAEAMGDILGITQQSLAATRQLSSANNDLVALSGSLSSLV